MAWILIDGYNLLPVFKCKKREDLLHKLASYLKSETKHTMTVVFDATAAGDSFAYRTAHGGVEVIFTPITQNADSLIEEMLSETRNQEVIVVSSDRAVQKSAVRWKHKFLSSSDFSFQIHKKLHAALSEKPMRDEERERPVKKGGNPRKLSKKEKLRKKLSSRI